MTDERQEIVPAGTKVTYPNGQSLVVDDMCAVGVQGVCYQTQAWSDRRTAERNAWAERSVVRRALGLPPKGYWDDHTRGGSLVEELVGNAFRFW